MRKSIDFVCGLAILSAGCGSKSGSVGTAGQLPAERVALEDVAEVYRVYVLTNGKPPENVAQLRTFSNVGPSAVKAIESGLIVVRYGAAMVDTNEGPASTPSDEVLAYEKKATDSGGLVLMLDRTIRTMSASELSSAKKAGKD